MRIRLYGSVIIIILLMTVSTEAGAGCGCNAISMMNAPMIESFLPLGGPGIDNTMTSSSNTQGPFNANVEFGVLYDSRVGAESVPGSTTGVSDISGIFRLQAGYKFPMEGLLGLRLGYLGSAQFFQDNEEFNVMNQSLIVEPHYTFKQGVLTLPVSFSSLIEDKKRDSYLYTISPTYTWIFSDFNQAISVYAIFSIIRDMDNNPKKDEDGVLWGSGVAYTKLLNTVSDIRLSLEYTKATYDDAPVYMYSTYTMSSLSLDDREDKSIIAGLKYNYRINSSVGFYTHYSFIHSTSNVEVNNYDRNILEVGISYRY